MKYSRFAHSSCTSVYSFLSLSLSLCVQLVVLVIVDVFLLLPSHTHVGTLTTKMGGVGKEKLLGASFFISYCTALSIRSWLVPFHLLMMNFYQHSPVH
jgi:hypothetical protein